MQVRFYSVQPMEAPGKSKYKVLVVGGGAGGCATAAKFAEGSSGLGNDVAVVEPSDVHYYQPIWTLVGAGLKDFQSSGRPMGEVLPESCDWIKDKAVAFDPKNNCVELKSGAKVHYDYLVLALGLQLDYDKVKGLQEALEQDPSVCSNYHAQWVQKTSPALNNFKGGNAIFTFPATPIKCAGAPQKIMYLADEVFRKNKVRDSAQVIYNTALPVIFGVKKYADALHTVVADRGITVNYRQHLTAVDHTTKTATFAMLDEDNKPVEYKYDLLHVSPPMSAPDVLKTSGDLTNEAGFVDLNQGTLQHNKYENVFGLGDCTSTPNAKTAAAVAAQSNILYNNLNRHYSGKELSPEYDGYTSCPLITSSKTCILAEFDYQLQPLETFPWNQAKERRTSYWMKASVIPYLYWAKMLKGTWDGPGKLRKLLHFGMGK